MKLFPNKTKIRQYKKLISIQEETCDVIQNTIDKELNHITNQIKFSQSCVDNSNYELAKSTNVYIKHKLNFISDEQKELEKIRKEILANYELLIKEY